MNKCFIPYEQALALKELGFDEPCFAFYSKIYGLMTTSPTNKVNEFAGEVILPLYQQAFSFFREKYNLDVTFRKMDYGPESQFTGYYFSIYKGNELIDIHGADKKCKLYKDSETECLIKLISIVKEQKL
jgi:hypothetical protein